jgi:hypothetical protein
MDGYLVRRSKEGTRVDLVPGDPEQPNMRCFFLGKRNEFHRLHGEAGFGSVDSAAPSAL